MARSPHSTSSDAATTHMQPAPQLPVATQLDVDALVQAEADDVQRLLHCGILLSCAPAIAAASAHHSHAQPDPHSGSVQQLCLLIQCYDTMRF